MPYKCFAQYASPAPAPKTPDQIANEIERASRIGPTAYYGTLPGGLRFSGPGGEDDDDEDEQPLPTQRFHFMTADDVVDTGDPLDPFLLGELHTPVATLKHKELDKMLDIAQERGEIIDHIAYMELNDEERDQIKEALQKHEETVQKREKERLARKKEAAVHRQLAPIAWRTGLPVSQLKKEFPSLALAS